MCNGQYIFLKDSVNFQIYTINIGIFVVGIRMFSLKCNTLLTVSTPSG